MEDNKILYWEHISKCGRYGDDYLSEKLRYGVMPKDRFEQRGYTTFKHCYYKADVNSLTKGDTDKMPLMEYVDWMRSVFASFRMDNIC